MHFGLRIRSEMGLAALAALAAMVLAYCSLVRSVEPGWVLAGMAGLVLATLLMRKWPLLLFAGFQFVGNFKTEPAQGFAFTDPTILLFMLCMGAIFLHVLFAFSNSDEWNLTSSFKGQAATSILFLLLVATIAISVLYTPTIQRGTVKALRFGVFESLSYFFPILFLRTRKDVRQLVLSFAVLGIALSVKVLLGLLYASDRVLSGDTDITKIGDGMLLGIALLMVFGNLELPKTVRFVAVPVLSFGLIACAARSPLVALFFTVVISLVCARREMARSLLRSVWVGTIVLTMIAVPSLMWLRSLPFAEQKLYEKQAELQSALSGNIFVSGTFAQRLSFYRSALDAMAQYPIAGVGVGGWSIFYDNADTPHFPHNFVLEVGAEQGLIGLTILLTLLVLLFRGTLRLLRSDRGLAFVFPVFVFCVVLNLITGDIESRPLWFCCGLAAAASRFCLPSSEKNVEPTVDFQQMSAHA